MAFAFRPFYTFCVKIPKSIEMEKVSFVIDFDQVGISENNNANFMQSFALMSDMRKRKVLHING